MWFCNAPSVDDSSASSRLQSTQDNIHSWISIKLPTIYNTHVMSQQISHNILNITWWAVRSYKLGLIGVCPGATGCLRQWEGPPLLSYRYKLGSPQTIRCWPATVWLLQWELGARSKTDKQTVNHALGKSTKKKNFLSYAEQVGMSGHCVLFSRTTWNVLTTLRKTTLTDCKLTRLDINIAALQEQDFPLSGIFGKVRNPIKHLSMALESPWGTFYCTT